jgi:hypothetical protein
MLNDVDQGVQFSATIEKEGIQTLKLTVRSKIKKRERKPFYFLSGRFFLNTSVRVPIRSLPDMTLLGGDLDANIERRL